MAQVSRLPIDADTPIRRRLDAAQQRLQEAVGDAHRALAELVALGVQAGAPVPAGQSADLPDMLSVSQLAERMSISETTVRDLLDRGEIREARLPGISRRLVRREDYLSYLERAK